MTKTVWPDFASLECAIFPDWLKTSVTDLIATYPDRIDTLFFQFWGDISFFDQENIKKKAEPYIKWFGEAPTEDEFDHVPAIRRMERNAVQIFHDLPIEFDDEADIYGHVEFYIDREGVHFTSGEEEGEITFELFAVPKDGRWHCAARITDTIDGYTDAGASDTVIISMDAHTIITELTPTHFGVKKFPDPKAIYTDDQECICIEFDIAEYVNQWEAENSPP